MHIKHISIKNYRLFSEPAFEIDLKPFTLILGENNIGKTNLISALGLIFSQEITIFRKRILDIDDINYSTIRKFKGDVCNPAIAPEKVTFPEVRIDVTLTDMSDDQHAIVDQWAINTQNTEAQLTYLFSPKHNFKKAEWVSDIRKGLVDKLKDKHINFVDFPISDYRYSIFGGNDPSRDTEINYWLQMLKMESLDALRDAPKELVASSDYRLLYRILNQERRSDYSDIKQILDQLDDIVDKNASLSTIKTEVKTLLDRVSLQSTDGDNVIDFRFSGMETSEILRKLALIYGVDPIDISRNGLGRNNLLFISLVLSQLSAKDSQGDKSYFRLIAVEEPESHLHPHLQDHLAESIEQIRVEAGGEMQIILTSHSTHIASQVGLENVCVIFYDAKSKGVKCHYVISNLKPESDGDTISYLKRYLDSTKSRMFFARKLILVEGFAEQFLIPELYKINSKGETTLEKIGVSLVNVNGIAFKHFLKVITGGYFIKCAVFTDQDTGTKTENRADNLKQTFNTPDLIQVEVTILSTFEKDLIEANKGGNGKPLMFRALKRIKPANGKKLADSTGEKDIDVEPFYKEIEDYKSEFAFCLTDEIKKAPDDFNIPEYIKRGFDFIAGET
jgi:predicted ATP-dependent endonuclease of OLD family